MYIACVSAPNFIYSSPNVPATRSYIQCRNVCPPTLLFCLAEGSSCHCSVLFPFNFVAKLSRSLICLVTFLPLLPCFFTLVCPPRLRVLSPVLLLLNMFLSYLIYHFIYFLICLLWIFKSNSFQFFPLSITSDIVPIHLFEIQPFVLRSCLCNCCNDNGKMTAT